MGQTVTQRALRSSFFSPPGQDEPPLPDASGAEVCYEQNNDDPETSSLQTVDEWYRTQVVPQFVGAVVRRMP